MNETVMYERSVYDIITIWILLIKNQRIIIREKDRFCCGSKAGS